MKEKERCGYCRYYFHDFIEVGECRRRSPVLNTILIVTSQDESYSNCSGEWPMVHVENWCGEWSPVAQDSKEKKEA